MRSYFTLFWWRQIVGSALAFGCSSWSVGSSVVCGAAVRPLFERFEQASDFARVWGPKVGVSVKVRRESNGWRVSVPALV